MDKERFVEGIKITRKALASGVQANCSCPNTKCEWHGDCYNCVRIHRHFGGHVPNCMQFILQDKIKAIARTAEMTAEPNPPVPTEYWDYADEEEPPDSADA